MTLSSSILENIDNSSNTSSIFNYLIEDEKSAIAGYREKFKQLSGYLDEGTINIIDKVFKHIIEEEQEHIEELTRLMNKINGE